MIADQLLPQKPWFRPDYLTKLQIYCNIHPFNYVFLPSRMINITIQSLRSELTEMTNTPTLIDADVHNAIYDKRDLLPYLPKAWHEQWLSQGIGVSSPFWTPLGVMRKDAVPPRGGVAGSDPHFMLQDHVDKYGFDYAILTGSGVLGISLHIDPDYANAVVSAYNDWLVEHWLKVSPKFKGSILINNSDPEAAAKEIDRMANNKAMVQVIMSSGSRTLYGQRFFHPIYEAAERNGLPVQVFFRTYDSVLKLCSKFPHDDH
jgi:predicted TIM-barrel fold metal-dependent hydrolase